MSELRRYRCENPRCDTKLFVTEHPVCPGCGIDGRVPKFARAVYMVKTIHFNPPDESGLPNLGKGYFACDSEKEVFGDEETAVTGEHAVVNCELCKESKEYLDSLPPSHRPKLRATV